MTKALLACRGFYFSYILFWPCISYLAHVTWAKKNEKSIFFFFSAEKMSMAFLRVLFH